MPIYEHFLCSVILLKFLCSVILLKLVLCNYTHKAIINYIAKCL
jgi:hypothetical protein